MFLYLGRYYCKMEHKTLKDQIILISPKLYNVAKRMLGNKTLAEDAVQEVICKIWAKRKKIAKHNNFNALAFISIKNHCLDIIKKQKPEVNIDDIYTLSSTSSDEENIVRKECNQIILQVIQTLPKIQREIMIMREIDGLEFNEIASITELKIEHIRVLLSRARKHVIAETKQIYAYEQQATTLTHK